MAMVCKNHPDHEAKQQCHYCEAPICSDCRITIGQYIYCGKKCYYKDLFRSFIFNTKKYSALAISSGKALLRNRNIFSLRNIFNALLITGIIVSIFVGISNQKKIDEIKETILVAGQKQSADTLAQITDSLKIFTPPPISMILRNRFDIEGETEENRIVSLSANGELLQAIIVKGRTFVFKDIIARAGQNHFVVRSFNEDGSSIILEEIKFFYGNYTASFLARDFSRGDLNQQKIALTFDGGYLNNTTAEILDILQQEQVKVTIFLTGIFIQKYPDLVRRMAEEGHEIGNHTWSHPHLTTFEHNRQHQRLSHISQDLIRNELLKTANLYRTITGKEMAPLWRSPYGEHNSEIRQWAAAAGFRHIGWTVGRNWEEGMDTMDWVADKNSPAYHSADEIADKILAFGRGKTYGANGAVILMHLGSTRSDDYPHQKLPMIINQLKRQGYKFVMISEML